MKRRRTTRRRNGLLGDIARGLGRAAKKTGRGYAKMARATHQPKFDAAERARTARGRRATDNKRRASDRAAATMPETFTDAQVRQMIKDRDPRISARPHRSNPAALRVAGATLLVPGGLLVFESGRRKKPGVGRQFTFHGAYQKKSDAVRKEQSTPGAFIKFVLTRSGGRFLVMKRNEKENPQRLRKQNVEFGEYEHGIFHPWTRRSTKQNTLKPAKLGKRIIPRSYGSRGRNAGKRKNPVAEYLAAKQQWEQARAALKMARTPAERRAADHDIEFWRNKMAHYNGAVVQFHKRANPRKKRPAVNRKRKANGKLDGAAQLYRDFHGREATKLTDVLQKIVSRDAYTGLGTLVRLVVNGETSIDFSEEERSSVMLASDPQGRQLFLIGGDQDVSALLDGRKGVDRTKDLIDLGELKGFGKYKSIEYFTRKKFDNFQPITYIHEFGEVSGVRPRLMYDRLNRQLHIVGGNYQVKPEGIVD